MKPALGKSASPSAASLSAQQRPHTSPLNISPLGRLVSVDGSIVEPLSFDLVPPYISWGRLDSNTIVHKDQQDTRIPKRAFAVFCYHPTGSTRTRCDRACPPHIGICTWATHGIWINGKHLEAADGEQRTLYGFLHTGDIIDVCTPHNPERMRFRCEINVGSGATPRPAGAEFEVLVDKRSCSDGPDFD
jgi:hypothetical protein